MARLAFLFPGQGAQKVGMGQQLHDTLPAARKLFDEAADILGYSLAELCFRGPAERLNSTVISQPALFVCSLAALEMLRSTEPDLEKQCVATAGLSLGEYTALVFAGALSFADGLRLVQQRGAAMQAASDATPSGMVAVVGMERPEVEALCQAARSAGTIQIANFLCPSNIVVSGTRAACDLVEKIGTDRGARTVRLAVAGAFHTDIMKPADQQLAAALSQVSLQPARIPVWSNVDARPHTDPQEIRELLIRQVITPVQWETTMRALVEEVACELFYEIGPGNVLAGLLRRVHRKADIRSIPA